MSEKKKILIFIDWFLPGYKAGGPIRSVANIVKTLSGSFDFYILTSDRDLGDETPFRDTGFNTEINTENYSIQYLTPENQNVKFYKKIIKKLNPDRIYFNSLFSFKFTILPKSASKRIVPENTVIVAPRGMLGKGALGIKKNKKKFFLFFANFFNLYSDVIWHATTSYEKDDIQTVFGKNIKIKIAGNIPEKPTIYIPKEKNKDVCFVFISRISEKKNILFAIQIFKHLKTKKNVYFDIYGPVENTEYKKLCEEESKKLPQNCKINFKGEISHNKLTEIYRKAHFFLLPSLHENYGHAVFEALSNSCPVILSDQTPWRNLEEKNIGWDISLSDKKKFADVIQKCIDMPQSGYDKMSENAFKFAKEFSENTEAIEQTKKLFE